MPVLAADDLGLIGKVIAGRFRVDRFIGRGDLSVVFKATEVPGGRSIALKCLAVPPGMDPSLLAVFSRGFREGAQTHRTLAEACPDLAPILDIGEAFSETLAADVSFFAREWYEGHSLGSDLLLRRAREETGRSLKATLELLEPAAYALAFAHGRRIAHERLNPNALFLAHSTGIKTLDFGVSRALYPTVRDKGGLLALSSALLAYVAPEQLEPAFGTIGPPTDVYALALIVLELLRDRPVMEARPGADLSPRILDPTSRPTASGLGIRVGAATEAVLSRAVAFAPAERYRDAREFWDALRSCAAADLAAHPSPLPLVPPPSPLPPVPLAPPSPPRLVPLAPPSPPRLVPPPPPSDPFPLRSLDDRPHGLGDLTPPRRIPRPSIPHPHDEPHPHEDPPPHPSAHPSPHPSPPIPAPPSEPTLPVEQNLPPPHDSMEGEPVRKAVGPLLPPSATPFTHDPSIIVQPPPAPVRPARAERPPTSRRAPTIRMARPPALTVRLDRPDPPPPRSSFWRYVGVVALTAGLVAGGALGTRVVLAWRARVAARAPVTTTATTTVAASAPASAAPAASSLALSPGPDTASLDATPQLRPFDPESARAALDANPPSLADCRIPKWKPLRVRVTFASDGNATTVVALPPYAGMPQGACAIRHFREARIAPFKGPPGSLVYPPVPVRP